MNNSRQLLLAVALLALTVTSCDKRPPDSNSEEKSKASATQKNKEKNDEPARAAPLDDHHAGRWKANDIHTHLGPIAYPIVKDVLDENDIHRVVNLSGGHSKDHRTKHLEMADRLENRVALFFNIEWENVDDEDFGEQLADKLENAVAQGFAGVKISKALGLEVETEDDELLPVDTPKLDPLWERAGQLGVPVTIHTSDPKAFFEEPGPENERWAELKVAPDWSFHGEEFPSRKSLLKARDRMVSKHPDTTFILAHMANNPEDMDYVRELLEKHDNLYVDTSARIAEFGRHPSEKIRKFFIDFQDRILFGTDLGIHAKAAKGGLYYSLFLGSVRKERPDLDDVGPFFQKHWRYFETDKKAIEHPIPIQGDWKVHPINLPHEVLAKIYWKNAEKVVFAPWLARRAARHVIERAED